MQTPSLGAVNGAQHLPIDRSNSLGDLAVRISAEHEAAGAATRKTLQHAIAAGELLIEAKDRVGHGRWENWLRKTCNVPPRSAAKYMKLAEGREILGKIQIGLGADLTVNGALRLLKPKTKKTEPSNRPKKKKPAIDRIILSSLVWSDAAQPARTSFVDAVGLQALYEAAPPDHQEHFLAWLVQKLTVEQSHPEIDAPIPDDLSIPDFLKREQVPEVAS